MAHKALLFALILPCKILYALLKALAPFFMQHRAPGESRVTNIARGEAECYICPKTLIKSCILSYKQSGGALRLLLYFILKDMLTEDIPLNFNICNK